ncbi:MULTISPECIES: 16S rRNA (uracil(1498)-N(3))-methyltransferase [Acinetobacter]|uniref:16S rRNA (uracil(1498)-N(3))-methyltransferase n=1 Tax=Acinetobacter TaxID=469 RepID=UPI00097FA5A1|nr:MULTISPECIES: 16S rRNA (uracil(1498)-N(3))-methyltransferase [Acinetobacter]MEB3795796.1 16S rRNA (uracil(1498)-N(3))-methyltransferase [Acinetobacter sp. IK24]MEB3814945.1 16S rRNA (uracil(1498)-N(3))-methyltransferase [Acinetobacter sp. IK22]MEB3834110.1 16S rRNA (uracil(1498)-N(3))-methyltransferase [Acinetobacter sp. IK23]MEB3838101.1 16S rRNA (uracil(1498)-N(3))-methyltransferase [Acinetobacter sp. IK25]ONN53370.1 16S rRNA methyltransferase [Acinetobacter genomosp. 33YU]
MNIVLLEPEDTQSEIWSIHSKRQLQHLREHLDITVGQNLKVGIRNGARYFTEIVSIDEQEVCIRPIREEAVPAKLPVHLIVALPRPKVLRRLIMDSVTLGVERISLIHSYRVDKSYWQTPFLQQIDNYVTLGLEQAGDTIVPEIQMYKRFKPFVEDVLPTLISETSPAYVAHPYADESMPNGIGYACTVIVGPEGGFIPYEVDLLTKNGCQAVSLGNRILRTETSISYILGRLFS